MKYWTVEDVNNGLCTVAEVGTPRPADEVMATPIVMLEDDLDKPLREVLRGAAKKAFLEMGPVAFLKANPDLLAKVLVRYAAPEPYAPPPTPPLEYPAWLTARRLMYQERSEVADDILSPDAKPRALPKAKAGVFGDSVLPPPEPE